MNWDRYVSPVVPVLLSCIGTESKRQINCYCKHLIERESVFEKKKSPQEITCSTPGKVLKETNQILKWYRQHCSEQWLHLRYSCLLPNQAVQFLLINTYLKVWVASHFIIIIHFIIFWRHIMVPKLTSIFLIMIRYMHDTYRERK